MHSPLSINLTLGNDILGSEALVKLKEWNIHTDYINIHDSKETGKCLVTLDENAVPCYDLKKNVAYDHIDCENINQEFVLLYFGTLALRDKYNKESLDKLLKKQKFKHVFVDVNIRTPFYTCESVAFCYECEQDITFECQSPKVKVVSTVGAGDSFSAAFVYQFFQQKDIQFCLDYATRVAGYVVSKYDAVPDYNVIDFL